MQAMIQRKDSNNDKQLYEAVLVQSADILYPFAKPGHKEHQQASST